MGFIVDLNLVTNFEFLGGPMSCFVFQDIFFLRSVWKVEGRGGFLPKKKKKKILEGTHPVARLLCPCSKKKLIN